MRRKSQLWHGYLLAGSHNAQHARGGRLRVAGQQHKAKAPLAHAYRGAEASAYRHGSEPNAVSAPLARAAAPDEQMETALALLVARHVL